MHELAREGNMTTVSSFKTQKLSLETNITKEEPLIHHHPQGFGRCSLDLSSLLPLFPILPAKEVCSGLVFVQYGSKGGQ